MHDAWLDSNGEGSVAFFVEGDFNGDGRKDAAVILIGTPESKVQLVVFEGTSQGYRQAYTRPLEKVGDLKIGAPQEIVLLLVRKGEEWAPEAGDVPQTYEHAFDAVAFETRKTDAVGSLIAYLHLVYWDGKRYAEY